MAKNDLRVAVAQFQPQSGDKRYNLQVIESLVAQASELGADVISFHELCITGYTFLKDLDLQEIKELSEEIPHGPSCQYLIKLAKVFKIHILAGLVEQHQGKFYNSYVCVNRNGVIARYRKIHPFISNHLSAGDAYSVFEIEGWKCGILICYDNNVIENVRATTLLGARTHFCTACYRMHPFAHAWQGLCGSFPLGEP